MASTHYTQAVSLYDVSPYDSDDAPLQPLPQLGRYLGDPDFRNNLLVEDQERAVLAQHELHEESSSEPWVSEPTTSEVAQSATFPAMALQAADALNRTFIELKSKNEDTRLRASYDLHNQVLKASRGKRLKIFSTYHS